MAGLHERARIGKHRVGGRSLERGALGADAPKKKAVFVALVVSTLAVLPGMGLIPWS